MALLVSACGSEPAPGREGPRTRVVSVFDEVHVSSVESAEYFQHAAAGVDFGSGPFERATLSVSLESPCFPFENWTADAIPEGHEFPRLCDGFDRTFLLSLDDPSDRAGEPPGIELARVITPFGGPLRFDVDVTDVANGLPGEHVLHADIQTWGDATGSVTGAEGEWLVSARLVLEPGPAPRNVVAVAPLAFGIRTSAEARALPFTVPAGTTSARIEYRTTGHGGVLSPDDASCIGPAEEFCRRTHSIELDGSPLVELLPWRADCNELCTLTSYESDSIVVPSYCAENPTGLPASVRAPRANWCPGSVTAPFVLESPELASAGEHELSVAIDTVAEGGQWVESLVLFAYE